MAIQINTDDLKIESDGIGAPVLKKTGEVLYTSRKVRITHIPTGISAECGEYHTQHRNRTAAYRELLDKLDARQGSGEGES